LAASSLLRGRRRSIAAEAEADALEGEPAVA